MNTYLTEITSLSSTKGGVGGCLVPHLHVVKHRRGSRPCKCPCHLCPTCKGTGYKPKVDANETGSGCADCGGGPTRVGTGYRKVE